MASDWPTELDPPPEGHPFWRDVSGHPIYQPKARMFAGIEAKRRIVTLHAMRENYLGSWCEECSSVDLAGDPLPYWPCATVRLIALPYRDHPSYRAEWEPAE